MMVLPWPVRKEHFFVDNLLPDKAWWWCVSSSCPFFSPLHKHALLVPHNHCTFTHSALMISCSFFHLLCVCFRVQQWLAGGGFVRELFFAMIASKLDFAKERGYLDFEKEDRLCSLLRNNSYVKMDQRCRLYIYIYIVDS